jgi:hypothetical protein
MNTHESFFSTYFVVGERSLGLVDRSIEKISSETKEALWLSGDELLEAMKYWTIH